MTNTNSECLLLLLASTMRKIHIDYTPYWGHGNPNTYIDNVTFPRVLAGKQYTYRVCRNDTDLGVRAGYGVQSDGSQKLNMLEWNGGHGIPQAERIRVYVVDPDSGCQYLLSGTRPSRL